MKFKVINGEPLQFHNQNGDLTGTIQISSSGDMIIRPESGSNNSIIIGDTTTTGTVEFGTVAAPVTLDLLGGGTLTSNGNTLTIGVTGDTVRINNAIFSQSLQITGSLRVTGSAYATYFVGDGSGLTNVTALSASYARTASYVNLVAGPNITINRVGDSYQITGSTGGGGASDFPYTGSAIISGSLTVTGSINATQGITGSLFGTSSFAITASYAQNALSSSFAQTASYAATSSFSLATSENRILVINKSGATIAKGVVVHLTGSTNSSDTPYITTASYENDNLSANTLGITAETIAFNSTGFVTTEGVLTGLDVTGFVAGQILYLGANGAIIGTAPQAPLHGVRLGQVVRDSPSNNGSIYVRIDNGYELDELHDVRIVTASLSYGDLLMRSGSVWTNSRQLTGSYGLTGSLSFNTGGVTGSLFGTASVATSASFLTSNTNAFIQGGNSFGATATLGTNDNQNLNIETNGSSRIFVSSSGQIGIGTTTPREQLGIAGGGMRIETSAGSEASTIRQTSFHSALYLASNLYYSGSTAPEANSYYILDSGSNNRGGNLFYIKTNGAAGATPSSGFFFYTAPSSSGANTLATLSENFRIVPGTASFSNNLIGIGITAPTAKLHVNNTGESNSLLIEDSTNPDATPFVINNAGSVGIGTTSPNAKLDVNGNTLITGSLTVTAGITGSLLGTSSWAQNSVTASFITTAQTASYVLNAVSASFATSASRAISSSYAVTASNATGLSTLNQNVIITGSLTLTNDLIVLGSASVQYITSSQLNIADNIITVNTITPSVRFGGLAVVDSGSSPQQSGSLLFDSQNNQWIFVHQSAAGAAVTSSMLLMGPQTFNNVGSETALTTNRLPKASGADLGEHLADSNITDTGTVVSINSRTLVTGSLTVTAGVTASLQGTASYAPNFANTDLTFTSARSHDIGSNSLLLSTTGNGTLYMDASQVQLVGAGNSRVYVGSNIGSVFIANSYSGILLDQNDSLSVSALASTSASIKVYSPKIKIDSNVNISGSLGVTGSLSVTQGITGSLFGTASWARNATTASFINVTNTNNASDYYIVGIDSDNGAQNPEQLYNFGTLAFNPDDNTLKVASGAGTIQASLQGTASWATNAVTAKNGFPYTGSAQITGSLGVTGSFSVYNYDSYSGTYYNNIDTTNKQIWKVFGIGIDPQPGPVIDWESETLSSFNSFGQISTTVDWGNKILYTAGSPFGINKASVDWGSRYLRYSNTVIAPPAISINWGAGTLNDTNGSVALEWDIPGTLTVSASMILSASVTASSGNSATSDAMLQATLLYLSNNF